MNLPLILPSWVPAWMPPWMAPWAQLLLLALALLLGFALLMMPFALLGQRGRFDLLEAQLDDIHAELRMLALRLPDAEPQRFGRTAPDEPYAPARRPAEEQAPKRAAPLRADDRPQRRDDAREREAGRDRSEPRLRWPPVSGGR